MAKDYVHRGKRKKTTPKKRTQPKRSSRKTKKSFPWLAIVLLIVLIILLIMGISYVRNQVVNSQKSAPKQSHVPVQTAVPLPKKSKPPAKQKIKFNFYTLLSKMKVEVPLTRSSHIRKATKNKTHYIIQLASFFEKSRAKQYQSKLKTLTFKTRLIVVLMDNSPIFRVQIGPFYSKTSANHVRDQLEAKHVDSILVN